MRPLRHLARNSGLHGVPVGIALLPGLFAHIGRAPSIEVVERNANWARNICKIGAGKRAGGEGGGEGGRCPSYRGSSADGPASWMLALPFIVSRLPSAISHSPRSSTNNFDAVAQCMARHATHTSAKAPILPPPLFPSHPSIFAARRTPLLPGEEVPCQLACAQRLTLGAYYCTRGSC